MTLVGTTVEQIRVIEPLGQGGMGEVYVGFDQRLHRQVALKALRGAHRLDADTKRRFLREARILSQLDHPNICRIHELIESEGERFPDISQQLTTRDPSNTDWQDSLAWDHLLVGDTLEAQGELPGAIRAWAKARDLYQRLVQQDQSNAGWLERLATVEHQLGKVCQAPAAAGPTDPELSKLCRQRRAASKPQ